MDSSQIDWNALQRLRRTFLEAPLAATDYWQSESDLASYDATFAQRIGWKWDYVLLELQRRGWSPPEGGLLDWGCGSGIASRATPIFPSACRNGIATYIIRRRSVAL